MEPNRYRFTCVWELPSATQDVYRTLEDIAHYPLWWPEVRRVTRLGERRAQLLVRSFLPYDLLFTVEEERRDPAAGVLEAALSGHLNGWSRWTVSARPGGSRVRFEEDVRPGRLLMRTLALPARPAFRANHAMMMRDGRRGLRAYLAGYRRGRAEAGHSAAQCTPDDQA